MYLFKDEILILLLLIIINAFFAYSKTLSPSDTSNTTNMALNLRKLPLQRLNLFVPPLEDIREALKSGLKKTFEEVNVEIVDCPDLTQQPFTLAGEGLCGKPKIIEVGGVPYLLPLFDDTRAYDLKDLAGLTNVDPAVIVGAGAGPHQHIGINCEGIYNLKVTNGTVDNQSRIGKIGDPNESCIQETLPDSETRCNLLGNFFLSEGKPGKVLKVNVKKRIGPENFISSIRKVLEETYEDKLVGLGGVFLLKEGKAKQHVMRDFSKTPITTEEQLNNWLKFFNMSAPLVAVGTLINGDGGLDLRVQHFHSFSHHGEAGHYHYDTTPNTVEYLGYFNVGEEIYRIDRPTVTHQFGRD